MIRRLSPYALTWCAVTLTWSLLWGEWSPGTGLAGALVATGVVVAVGWGRVPAGAFRPWAVLHLGLHVTWSLVKATTLVAWEVVTPRNRIVEGIIAVPLPSATPVVLTVVTNAIGLTPGTVVVEVEEDPCVLYVHVLHLIDVERVRAELTHLEALALRAFGPREALEAATRLDEEAHR